MANATVELPEILVDQEVEVMHDEFRGTLARQGIEEPAYLTAVEKTEADLHSEFRPGAEKRVKTLLVLSKVADEEGVEVPEADIQAEIDRGRERYAADPKLVEYFASERGRAFIRSSLRRSRVVESHHRRLARRPSRASAAAAPGGRPRFGRSSNDQAEANANIGATDPGSILTDEPATAG